MKTNDKPSWSIGMMIPLSGFFNRVVVNVPILGKRIIGMSNNIFGKALPRLSFLGFRKEKSYENAIWNWEIFLHLIGAEYTVEETEDNLRTYTISKCPAGYCHSGHLNACLATMELDHSLVESSGARLVVEKRFPIDGVCIEKIVSV
ncbi:MAG: hypothetical protein QNJ97_22375 [Myxococcota bacterium]|nr:hypothetical protein [Myxococcota bacterium]